MEKISETLEAILAAPPLKGEISVILLPFVMRSNGVEVYPFGGLTIGLYLVSTFMPNRNF